MTIHKRPRRAIPGPRSAPGERMKVPLTGTVHKATIHQSLESEVAVGFAIRWAEEAGRPGVSNSAVVRRALALYVQHLEAPTTDKQAECSALVRCSSAQETDEATREAAAARLTADEFLPFADVLKGPTWRQEAAAKTSAHEAFMARHEALMQHVMNDPVMRRKATSEARMASQSPAIPSTQTNPSP